MLKSSGMRLTPQRLSICKLIAETDSHPTAAEIYKKLKTQFPSLSLMTVYNTLNTLVGLGAINILGMPDNEQLHYDSNTSPHIHLICLNCHRIMDMESPLASKLKKEIINSSGFNLTGSRIVYYGQCPDCQKLKIQ